MKDPVSVMFVLHHWVLGVLAARNNFRAIAIFLVSGWRLRMKATMERPATAGVLVGLADNMMESKMACFEEKVLFCGATVFENDIE